jgi:hypothetical protein
MSPKFFRSSIGEQFLATSDAKKQVFDVTPIIHHLLEMLLGPAAPGLEVHLAQTN